MTRRTDLSPSVLEQASAWAVRLSDAAATEADWLALEDWLAQSPDHAAAYTEAEGLLAALDDERGALDAALTRAAAADVGPAPPTRLRRTPAPGRRRWMVGAGLAVAAAVVAGVALTPALMGATTVYVTAPGEQRTVTLGDGSTLVLNGGSRLTVRMTGRERSVEMDQAEAAFDVAHDASRPFRVTVGESRVEVLGTAFDIRRDSVSTRVAVTRGLVRVSDLDDPARNVRLGRGQSVERDDGDGVLQVSAGAAETAGWRTGRLIYEDRPLSDVATDLNRAYATPIRLTGDVGALRFTGVLALDGDQTATLRRLEAFLPVRAVPTDGAVELRAR
ncbi:FecR family protein [Brevundimonas sp.]|jgi:transmembrane sensor|uniref:FecR family protein n=1 Tax=Brevundimonas sp. TaxID=1871086 RepID=UPI0037C04BAC